MQEIHSSKLVEFSTENNDHVKTMEKNVDYPFYKNINLIKKLLTKMEFTGGISVDESDFAKYVLNNTLLVGIDIYNIDSDGFKYLFDAFNVYFAYEDSDTYDKSDRLTKEWRKLMKEAYSSPEYIQGLKDNLNLERQELIQKVNNDIDEQINNL